jgi:hypothetical protein
LTHGVIDICLLTANDICKSVSDLERQVEIEFVYQPDNSIELQPNQYLEPVCAWWDSTVHAWSTKGTVTTSAEVPVTDAENPQTVIRCSTSHLTEFTVLEYVGTAAVGESLATQAELDNALLYYRIHAGISLVVSLLFSCLLQTRKSIETKAIAGYLHTMALQTSSVAMYRAIQTLLVWYQLNKIQDMITESKLVVYSHTSMFMLLVISTILANFLSKLATDLAQNSTKEEILPRLEAIQRLYAPLVGLLAIIVLPLSLALPFLVADLDDATVNIAKTLVPLITVGISLVFVSATYALNSLVLKPNLPTVINYRALQRINQARGRKVAGAIIRTVILLGLRAIVALISNEASIVTNFHMICDTLGLLIVLSIYLPSTTRQPKIVPANVAVLQS